MNKKELGEIGEFKLIEKIRKRARTREGVIVGIGDDCAVLRVGDNANLLLTSDLLVEGVHFYPDVNPRYLGWKALAVSLSDISAMGGKPLFSLLSLSLPSHLSDKWLNDFLSGWEELADIFEVSLVGGDMSEGERIAIDSIVLGEAKSPILRSGAKVGDKIFVTGYLGDSSGGLLSLQGGLDFPSLINKHNKPFPRVMEGLEIGKIPGVHSMIDISDGLASDLKHICEESGKGALIFVEKIPLSPHLLSLCQSQNLSPLDFALFGGEDYELLFTGEAGIKEKISFPIYEIGEIIEEKGIWLVEEGKRRKLAREGFEHFRKRS
ncbi:thiamine-phosphate kinase [bacterium]|nr:thiamine-phosphate kinase [bacterium]